MSTWSVIPFTPNTPQRISTQLLNVTYNLRTRFSRGSLAWMLDLSDINQNLIVGSLVMVTGCDLLEQFHYLGIGGGLYVYNTGIPAVAVPQFNNLGVNSFLVFVPYG